jgi:O-acetyl-ADP-ribose deacetylase
VNEKIKIIKGDITTLQVDAIVNAANTTLLGGGGVDGAIHRAAGPGLLHECENLHGCSTGNAKITKGYNLSAKFVIHTVGPIWRGGKYKERELLEYCYTNSLALAVENDIKTIAFPSISTGAYRFPIYEASEIAIKTVIKFLKINSSIEQVFFVCFSENDLSLYQEIFSEIY